jgi:hypothetical protein
LLDPFTVDISYTSVKSVYGEGFEAVRNIAPGKRIPNIPSGSFFVRLTTKIPSFIPWSQNGGSISLEYRWNGGEYGLDGYSYYKDQNEWTDTETSINSYDYYKDLSGYSKFNLRCNYYVLDEHSVFIDVYNILNNQDWIGGAGPMIGRQISLGFNLAY